MQIFINLVGVIQEARSQFVLSRSLKIIFVTEEFVVVQMLSNVLEVLAVLHKDVGKAGNRPADVDDGEDDDGDLGTKILSSFRPCAIFIPTPACPPSGLGSAVSETEEDMVTDRIRSSKTVKTYRRANDDEDADGQEGEVDDWLRG